MTGYEFFSGYWWIFPVTMMVLCFFFMRRCSARRFCGFFGDIHSKESTMDILSKRYAQGEIDLEEFQEKKRLLETMNRKPSQEKGNSNDHC